MELHVYQLQATSYQLSQVRRPTKHHVLSPGPRAGYSMNRESLAYPTQIIEKNVANSILSPSIEQTTQHPEELQYVLLNIPTIEQARKTPTEKVIGVVKEKPFAMDLADELRKIRVMKVLGDNPENYWQFFKAQSEYYANESYAKLGVISYEHQLVNDHGNLRLWIEPMGKSAKESYEEAGLKGGPDWYVERCNRETAQVDTWEALTQQHLSKTILIDVSPAPDVPEEKLEGTMFGKHSFLRASQLVYDEQGIPYVYSRAFRTYLPPSKLEELMYKTTGTFIPADQLLGNMSLLSKHYNIKDLRDDAAAIQFQSLLDQLWEETPAEERPEIEDEYLATAEEMKQHYKALEPGLRAVFDAMVADRDYEETDIDFLKRVVKDFQNWEKKVKGKVTREWDTKIEEIKREFVDHGYSDSDILERIHLYFNSQEYQAEANSCGIGSGASILQTNVLAGSSAVYGGSMSYGELSVIQEGQSREVCVTCPYCKNKKGNIKVNEKYMCGNKSCPSNKRK